MQLTPVFILSLWLTFDLAFAAGPTKKYPSQIDSTDINTMVDTKTSSQPRSLFNVIPTERKLFYWAECKGSTLNGGEKLYDGECICKNSVYYMCMTYGSLEMLSDVRGEGYGFWRAHNPEDGNYAHMQKDGNLVIYDVRNVSVWASHTAGNPDANLKLNKQGSAIIVSPSSKGGTQSVLWEEYERGCKWVQDPANNTILKKGEILFRGQYICRNQYRFGMNDEGDLVILYRDLESLDNDNHGDDDEYMNDYEDDWNEEKQEVVWKAETSLQEGWFLKMKKGGNLKVYNKNEKVIWSYNANSNGNAQVQIHQGGLVMIVAEDGSQVWKIN